MIHCNATRMSFQNTTVTCKPPTLLNNQQSKIGKLHIALTEEELGKFRTYLCEGHRNGTCRESDSCPHSHCLTWQRRSPYEINYSPKLCPEIEFIKKGNKMSLTRRCNKGRMCMYAHSKEEELYHPLMYKTKMCTTFPFCKRCYCPFAHNQYEIRKPKLGACQSPLVNQHMETTVNNGFRATKGSRVDNAKSRNYCTRKTFNKINNASKMFSSYPPPPPPEIYFNKPQDFNNIKEKFDIVLPINSTVTSATCINHNHEEYLSDYTQTHAPSINNTIFDKISKYPVSNTNSICSSQQSTVDFERYSKYSVRTESLENKEFEISTNSYWSPKMKREISMNSKRWVDQVLSQLNTKEKIGTQNSSRNDTENINANQSVNNNFSVANNCRVNDKLDLVFGLAMRLANCMLCTGLKNRVTEMITENESNQVKIDGKWSPTNTSPSADKDIYMNISNTSQTISYDLVNAIKNITLSDIESSKIGYSQESVKETDRLNWIQDNTVEIPNSPEMNCNKNLDNNTKNNKEIYNEHLPKSEDELSNLKLTFSGKDYIPKNNSNDNYRSTVSNESLSAKNNELADESLVNRSHNNLRDVLSSVTASTSAPSEMLENEEWYLSSDLQALLTERTSSIPYSVIVSNEDSSSLEDSNKLLEVKDCETTPSLHVNITYRKENSVADAKNKNDDINWNAATWTNGNDNHSILRNDFYEDATQMDSTNNNSSMQLSTDSSTSSHQKFKSITNNIQENVYPALTTSTWLEASTPFKWNSFFDNLEYDEQQHQLPYDRQPLLFDKMTTTSGSKQDYAFLLSQTLSPVKIPKGCIGVLSKRISDNHKDYQHIEVTDSDYDGFWKEIIFGEWQLTADCL